MLFLTRLVILVLLCVPVFLFELQVISVLIPSAEGDTTCNLPSYTGCEEDIFYFYTPQVARECTKDRWQEGNTHFHPPNYGTGWCEVDLRAKKIPRTFLTFLNEVFPDADINEISGAR